MDINQAFPGLNITQGSSVKQMLAKFPGTRINYNSELYIFSSNRLNGVITDRNLNIVAYPCKPLVPNGKVAEAPVNVYHAEDGTTVMLYCWTDGWHMATKTCLDVADFIMPGTNMTYRDALTQVLSEDAPEFDITKLNTGLSYTIGFHHPEFHPFDRVYRRSWLVGAYDRSGVKQSVQIGIPEQKPVKIAIETALANCEQSIDHYLTTASQPNNRSHPRLGYIFEYNTHRVYVASTLYQKIERFAYDNLSPSDFADRAIERSRYIALRAAVLARNDPEEASLFPQIFPRLAPLYNEAKSKIANHQSRNQLSIANFDQFYFDIWGGCAKVVDDTIRAALE